MAYYTLVSRPAQSRPAKAEGITNPFRWAPQSGAYEREEIEFEKQYQRDCDKRNDQSYEYKIIKTPNARASTITKAIADLNTKAGA